MQNKLTDKQREEKKKKELITSIIICTVASVYLGLLLGAVACKNPDASIIDVFSKMMDNPFIFPFPTDFKYVGICVLISAIIDVFMWEKYQATAGVVTNPNGDAAFEEDFLAYDKEFVIDPKIVEKTTQKKPKTFYTEEHKKVVTSPKITNKQNKKNQYTDKIYAACWKNTQIYANKVALSLNGSWSQRNSNAVIFGASGSGKSRYFLNPNLLQYNSNYIVTDPSGEIMAGYGAGLREHGYIVKCLNISEMNKSCRYNPLYYIREASDIPVIVTTLMTNTQQSKNTGGDGDFWQKTTQALLCAIIGYLFEVEPIERRNFYNVLEILRLAQIDENDTQTEETEFDRMFEKLGQKNPNSYAFHQYETYHLAPRKTALNILISTAVLISTYIDIPDFNNLTYKDEIELDKFGAAPFKLKAGAKLFSEDEKKYEKRYEPDKNDPNALPPIPKGYIDVEDFEKYAYHKNNEGKLECLIEQDKLGRYVEGEPYKVAVFLAIPTADTTYNWLTAMLYSVVFKLVYRRGESRAKQQVQNSPELALHARFLIDECANIGKIPNLQEYLATCRKYKISIVPIFQSFSQITKVYGKEDANSIIANCDTTLFLGGVDSETLKIVCDRLGKETVKSMSTGRSNGGRNKSNSQNIQSVGRELMSRIQVEQMSNSECIVLIRALKPFKVKKFALQDHPNYKFTAEANPEKYSFVNPFRNEYNDGAIEVIRIKKYGEEGYVEPKEVESARLRALKEENRQLRAAEAAGLLQSAPQFAVAPPENASATDKKNHRQFVDAVSSLLNQAIEENDNYVIPILYNIIEEYNLPVQKVTTNNIQSLVGLETKSSEAHRRDIERANAEIRIDKTGENFTKYRSSVGSKITSHNPIRSEFGPASDNSAQIRALLGEFFSEGNKPDTSTKPSNERQLGEEENPQNESYVLAQPQEIEETEDVEETHEEPESIENDVSIYEDSDTESYEDSFDNEFDEVTSEDYDANTKKDIEALAIEKAIYEQLNQSLDSQENISH